MNYINKKTLITLIFLVSLVQLSHGNIFSKNFESDHLISTSKTLSTGNFYDNYQTNWKNVKKYKTGYFWNRAKPTTIKTAASATSNSLDDKQSYISANGYSPKTKNKVSFSGDSNKSFTNSSSACSPETPLEITEGSGWGISRSTLNNSGVPSFCLNISKNAPSPNEVFNTTLDPNSDISFNNSNYTKAQIRELVQRTVAVITHPNYAPSNLPTGLMSNFYRSIQSTVWHWTNNTNINNNYSWTASNGNTYDADDLKGWVSNGTLIATDVFWLVPNNSNTQPEILLNQTSRPATIVTNVTICSNSTYKWSVNGVTYNGSAGNKSVTVQGNTTVNSQGVTCAANKTLNLTVTPQVTAVNSTTTTAIAENHTKTLVGSPSGGTWSVVSGGGTISGTTYTPADISINTNVTVKYTIPANGGCSATTSSVTFTVTPMVDPCDAVASGNLDTDKDGVSDICDLDDDNDGILDTDESCSPRYASFESDINDVNNKHNAEGAADGNYAEIYNNNQQLILDLGQVFPSGTQYQITWRKKSNASGTAVIDLSESTSPNSGFINHPTSPQTSTSGSFITTTVTANVNFRYIAFNKGNSSTTDYDLDAVGIICLPSDTDKDGIIDSLDTDSDNDGCPDAFEGAANLTTTATLNGGSNGGSSANLGTTVNSNGIPTAAATSTITGQNTTNAVKTAEQITVVTAPANTGAVTGTNATLTVSATASKTTTYSSGTPNYNSGSSSTNTLTYKWYKNSAPNTILATTSSLTLNNVTAANAGDYTVKIIGTNNKCGVTRTATLTICPAITNSTTTTSITEDQTKTLAGSPTGGTFSIVSGGGTITNGIYKPANITANTAVVIRYTIAAAAGCLASTADVTFNVTTCPDAVNSTTTTSITEDQTKTLAGSPIGGTFSIISGGGTITNGIYKPANITANTAVVIRYTIAAAAGCLASTADVTFNVTTCPDAVNSTTTTSITEDQTKTLAGSPTGGTFSIISGGGTITNGIYKPADVNATTSVTIRYTIAAANGCNASFADKTFDVTCIKPADVVTNETICSGESFTWNGSVYTTNQTATTITNDGCTANQVLNLTVTPKPADIVTNETICSGESFTWNGSVYTTNQTATTITNDGCTANQVLNLTVTPKPADIVTNETICSGESFTWNGSVYTTNQTATTITNDGCTANQVLNLTVTPKPADIVTNETICSGESFTWNGSVYTTNQTATTITNDGCTANQVLNLTVTPKPADVITNKTINSGESFTWNGTVYTTNQTATTITNNGCTANQVLNLTVTANSLGSIGDLVWYDTDGDAIKDTNENGLGGATVTLDPGTPANTADDVTTTTDVNGNYLFANLPVGTYTITVDISTITSGLPAGVTIADLIPIFDGDGAGTANTSTLSLPTGVNNLSQDFAYSNTSGNTGGGNDGGVESESLGDAISKIYVGRKKNSLPTEFVKSTENLYSKAKMKSEQPYQGKGQTMLDMFPTQLVAGNVANVTSPTDILDYTVADEVLSVDFSVNGKTKGVVLGIKTSDKIYNHTKASCDRLRGAEILNIQTIQIKGYNFLMQGIKQRNGIVEYAISFATAKNNNDTKYTIQTNWYVNNYTKFNDVYNFQVWSTKPADTKKLVTDILENLQSFIPVKQTEIQKVPETYASKIYRNKADLVVKLRSTEIGKTAEVSMVELYSETANNIKFRNNSLSTEIQQSLVLDIADGYEYEALVKVDGEVEDAFYHADGNWGLDYDKKYTEIEKYFVWNNFDREYKDEEYAINRDVEVKATSEYDYLTVYKSLLPGTISADYSEYGYLSFTAKGSGLIELGLVKSSIQDWKSQYRVMVNLSEEEQTYYVPFNIFSSTGSTTKISADDLTTITFTFLPVEANTKKLDLKISDVKFTKTAVENQTVGKIEQLQNKFMAYPNPSKGNVNVLLFSKVDAKATVSLYDVTGKEIYNAPVQLTTGKNEIDFNVKVKPGILFLKVNSKQTNYGTSKIFFR